MKKIHVCYLLESTQLCGGVRVVFDQARALEQLGCIVTVRAAAGTHCWYSYPLNVVYCVLDMPFDEDKPVPDVIIATFWTTVQPALNLGVNNVVHLCQGFEGDIAEYTQISQQIDFAYSRKIPKLTVSSWLNERIYEKFGKTIFPVYEIGQIVDVEMYTPQLINIHRWYRRVFNRPYRVLVVGMYGVKIKAIADALLAVKYLREEGVNIELVRVSTLPLSEEEAAITSVEEYHCNLTPLQMRDCYRSVDILLAPSLSGEGFGLPLAEAMACGVCCVATRIPSFTAFDIHKDYAVFTAANDPMRMAESLRYLINNSKLQLYLRYRGPQVISRFTARKVALKMKQIFLKMIDV